MSAYYLYLFSWSKLFGLTEYALRAANLPFIMLFSTSLVLTSRLVFDARYAWLVLGTVPFIWHYAGEARAYMALLAFSTAAFGSLLCFLRTDELPKLKVLPYICLGSILVGSCFHMLCLLAAPPLLAMFLLSPSKRLHRWRFWTWPSLVFSVPFLTLLAFFGFTFYRGTAYGYPGFSPKQILSLAYDLLGFATIGPNRNFDLDFISHLWLLAGGSFLFVAGALCAIVTVYRTGLRGFQPLLIASCATAVVEVGALTVILNKQVELRHCIAVIPSFMFLLLSSIGHCPDTRKSSLFAYASGSFLFLFWIICDARMLFLPEYQREDYKDAVKIAAQLTSSRPRANVALFGDPLAGAYYGLDLRGDAPCFPLTDGCSSGLSRVAWPRQAVVAEDAWLWSRKQTETWFSESRRNGTPMILIIESDRSNRFLPWWPLLLTQKFDVVNQIHGFKVALLK